jgi:hypothetical protein
VTDGTVEASAGGTVPTTAKERYDAPQDRRPRRSRFAGVKHSSSSVAIYISAVFVSLVLVCAITLSAGNVLSIAFVFEQNYNEGWNVYNTQRLVDHQQIYDANYWRVNNYPLVSFLIVASIDFLIHDLLLSGRIVALVSFAAIGVLAAIATRRFGGERIDAVFGGGCSLGFCYLMAPSWIMVDDPQTLGEAVMLGGLVSYISRPPDRLCLFRTAFLVVLGGFIKHNLAAIPLAIALDLAIRSPRRLLFWLACCTGLTAASLGLTQLLAGGTFIEHLMSPRVFAWYGARYHLMKYLRLFKFPLIAIVLCSRLVFPGDRIVLAAYGIISIVVATIFSSFEGTSYNMFQDAAVFLGIASGVMLCELRRRVPTQWDSHGRVSKVALGVLPFFLAQPILARTPEALQQFYHINNLFALYHQAEETFLDDVKYILERHGPVICESLLLCYVAGQPFILDPFNSRQYILSGRLDEGELIRRIAAREFAVIQVRADICDDPATASCHILHYPQKFNRFTDEALYAIDRYYQIGRRSRDGTFYVPK